MEILIQIGTELFVFLLLAVLVLAMRKRQKFQRHKGVVYGSLLFLLFASIFSFHRHEIYAFNSWLFALTGEIQQIKFAEGGKDDDIPGAPQPAGKTDSKDKKTGDKKTTAAAKKTDSTSSSADKPVRSNLPTTPEPKILQVASCSIQDMDDNKLPLFPPLRIYNGTEWKKEKTDIRMACDGQTLYASFLCYDADPASLVTKYSETEGTSSAWKDDSIELFLMNGKKADCYYQIVSSASGLSHIFYFKNSENIAAGINQSDFPPSFKKPFITSEKCKEGYKVTMEINLKSLDFPKLDNGKEILLQIVRNYRDASNQNAASLQLFPVFIYGDNRYGKQNHDRRAFMPAKISK